MLNHAETCQLSASELLKDPFVQQTVRNARNNALPSWRHYDLPSGHRSEFTKEGVYPLVSHEGSFEATLLRILPYIDTEWFRGGEFRIIENKRYGRGETKALIIVDDIPLFLKELSDTNVQHVLTKTRLELAAEKRESYLIQRRATTANEGELRNRIDGQQDILEEQWYAKILRIMKLYPGMEANQAAQIITKMGEKAYLSDTGTAVQTVLSHYYDGDFPEESEVKVLRPENLLVPFGEPTSYDIDHILEQDHALLVQEISATSPEDTETIEHDGRSFTIQTLATYPIIQDSVEFQAKLLQVQEKNAVTFRTFRILQYGNPTEAHLRIDSICENGVQSGDNHCDCRKQTENEKKKAQQGIPIILINIRDDEGRGHGEAKKGGTLSIQRNLQPHYVIGNVKAAELFYERTKEPVDVRDFTSCMAVLKFLKIDTIAHFVTNNQQKIACVRQVCTIKDVQTAEVADTSEEAVRTKIEKANGGTHIY